MNMAMKLNYRPSDLGYYTTWWLTAKPSISSQTRTSPKTCIKFDDKCVAIQQVIIYIHYYTFY
jgi:hypothetical protein